MASFLRVKICGITNAVDGPLAATFGADAIGLNFYPQSPRYVDDGRALRILRELPVFVEPVAVFVSDRLAAGIEIAKRFDRIRTIQWTGDNRQATDPAPFSLIASFRVRDQADLKEIELFLDSCRRLGSMPAALLVDTHVPGKFGGTGQTAPWSLLAGFQPGVPLILAGGLTPENVAEAVRIVRPYGVDVASGVESSPGQKDADKIKRFIANAREAAMKIN